MPLLQAAPYEEEAAMQLLDALMSQEDDGLQLEDVSNEQEEDFEEDDGGIEQYDDLADVEQAGCNRRWYGLIRSLPNRLRSFLRRNVRTTVKCAGDCTRLRITSSAGATEADFELCMTSE